MSTLPLFVYLEGHEKVQIGTAEVSKGESNLLIEITAPLYIEDGEDNSAEVFPCDGLLAEF